MATILREATHVRYDRRPYHQVDPVPNLPTSFFPKLAPFQNRSTFPERMWPKPPVQDFYASGVTTRGIPVKGRDPNIFRTPLVVPIFALPRLQPDPIPNNLAGLYKLTAPNPPFTLDQFPEIFRRNYGETLGFEFQCFLPGPGQLPFIPVDFPTPMRAKANPQDFVFSSTGIPPLAPFNQDDWPITFSFRQLPSGFEWSGATTRGIPAGVAVPFNQDDWPVTFRKKEAYADSYESPQILLITPITRPFSQTDFPNPPPYKRLREDWMWSGTTTRGITPVPPSSGPFAGVYLEGYWIDLTSIILRWTASLGAAGYRLYINGVPQSQILLQRFTIVNGLAIDTSYTFNIVCVNAFGNDASILSNPVAFEHGSNEIGTYHTKPWN